MKPRGEVNWAALLGAIFITVGSGVSLTQAATLHRNYSEIISPKTLNVEVFGVRPPLVDGALNADGNTTLLFTDVVADVDCAQSKFIDMRISTADDNHPKNPPRIEGSDPRGKWRQYWDDYQLVFVEDLKNACLAGKTQFEKTITLLRRCMNDVGTLKNPTVETFRDAFKISIQLSCTGVDHVLAKRRAGIEVFCDNPHLVLKRGDTYVSEGTELQPFEPVTYLCVRPGE